MSNGTFKGTVKFFNHKNGFGFVRDDDSGAEYYVNEKDCNTEINEGDSVSFELAEAKKGAKATNVSLISS